MRHKEFAERMAGRLEAVAAALDEEERRIGRNPVSARQRDAGRRAHAPGRVRGGNAGGGAPVRVSREKPARDV
jgi:hypothetical protein